MIIILLSVEEILHSLLFCNPLICYFPVSNGARFFHQLPLFHVCEASRLRHGRVLWRDGGPTHGNLVGFWGSVVDNQN